MRHLAPLRVPVRHLCRLRRLSSRWRGERGAGFQAEPTFEYSDARLHSRWPSISQLRRCLSSQDIAPLASVRWAPRREAGHRTELLACPALSSPFGGRCVGSRGSGCSGRPAPHFRSRSVGGAWGGRLPGGVRSPSALPFVSQPRRALRGAAKTRAARTPKLGRGARYRAAVGATVVTARRNSRPRRSPTRVRRTAQRRVGARGAGRD